MHLETELDDIYSERLARLQRQLQKPLSEIIAAAIDTLTLNQPGLADDAEPSSLYQALDKIGFIGCIDTDEQLSTTYKDKLDFSHKCGGRQ
ncbi:MAG: hypothetical protein NTX45_29030 [Proteobacteria bacterium]|nr:hypothetical protein [Pseudomonadota bacterium]